MSQYNYKVLKIKPQASFMGGKFNEETIEKELNHWGTKGWELVSVIPSNQDLGQTRDVIIFLKIKIN
ncbi:MAG: DUF4177 domain-containing protein [Mycoplasmoidaceae bacterium]